MLKLANPSIVGAGEHRSGWPYVMDCCRQLFTNDAEVLFDDFLERTFMYENQRGCIYKKPWVAVLHHPPDMPDWYMPYMHLQQLSVNDRFLAAQEQLLLVFSLGEPLTSWWQQHYPQIPVVELRHPTGRPLVHWSPARFQRNPRPKLLQVGWFLRNMAGIYQCNPGSLLTPAHVRNGNPWVQSTERLCKKMSQEVLRPTAGWNDNVVQIPRQSDVWYDILLAENVVFIELLSAVANNTVVECIARNTPIVVNRHPGPVTYLGEDYPLFFDDLAEVPELVTTDRIMAAHHYLTQLDKWWISGPLFAEQLKQACLSHIPELVSPAHDDIEFTACML